MVDDVLQVAKLESGEIGVERVEFAPHSLIENCIAEYASGLEEAGKRIEIAAPEQLILNCDQRLLRRVFGHLLSNAVKFTKNGDAIKVEVSASEREGVRIEISDTGIGVSAEHLSKLANPFYQADGCLHRSHEGAGLGLYLARQYIALHEGTLDFESDENAFFKAIINLPPTCLVRRRDAA